MENQKPLRKGFETGGKINSPEEWEELEKYWIEKSPNERLEAIEELRKQYILSNKIPQGVDWSYCGIRTSNV
ncbi:MAG: hypothetical protein ABI855_13880 [Bacteroidota bacterium]